MFGGKLKQEYQLALARLAQSEQEAANLRSELDRNKRECDAMRAEMQGAHAEHGVFNRLHAKELGGKVTIIQPRCRRCGGQHEAFAGIVEPDGGCDFVGGTAQLC